VPRVGDDGPVCEHDELYELMSSLPESDRSRRSGAWYKFVNMSETWKGGICEGAVMICDETDCS